MQLPKRKFVLALPDCNSFDSMAAPGLLTFKREQRCLRRCSLDDVQRPHLRYIPLPPSNNYSLTKAVARIAMYVH